MVSVPANVDAGARRRAVRHAPAAAGEASAETGGEPAASDSTDGLYAGADRLPARILATIRAARYHGVDLDPNEFRPANRNGAPSPVTSRIGRPMAACGLAPSVYAS